MSITAHINNLRARRELPFTRGERAAQRAREAPDFHTLSQAERDRRVMEAVSAA
ncbi:hypothetical protein [uncultured Sphingobium sp.]|uniref:hypothetical protein n=1 Tax=uncultured Sphingobium sp. TaxID=316087 RepID=UPI0032B1CADE|tara:strand:- start:10312 stop:10473 length:162 start_codon:yes stop_codon:yes gene_type:complete